MFCFNRKLNYYRKRDTRTYTYPNWREVKTPGFDGNAALYQSVINLYQNTTGYFTHDETIDVDSVIASII